MAMNNLGLGFIFRATDMASPVMRKVEGGFKKMDGTTAAAGASMTKHMAGVAAGLGVAAVGAVGLALAFKSASAFGEFDAALAKVQGRLGASAEDMKILEDRAKRAGLETEFSPVEAVQGLEELTAKGLNATDAATALGGALNLAAAGQISVSAAANTVSAAMNVFGIEAARAGEVADKLLKVTSLTALSAGDMELAMGNLGRGVSQTNQEFEDMLVLTGLVKNTGVDVSVASSSISSALLALGKNAKQFRKLGIEVTDAKGEFKSLQEVMVDAEQVMAKKFPDAADRAAGSLKLFTKFGLTSFGAVMKQANTGLKDQNGNIIKGADAIANYIARVKGAKGMGDAAMAAKENTLPGQLKLLQGSLQTLAIEFGRAFSDVFKPIVKGVKDFVNVLIDALAVIPGPVKKVVAALFVMASVILLVGGVVLALVSGVALLKMAFIAFMPPLGALGVGIGIAAGVLLGLVAIFKTVKVGFDENIGGFGDAVKDVFGKVKLYFSAIGQLMSGDGKLRGGVLKKLLDPANSSIMRMVQRFQQARHRVSQFFTGLKEGAKGVLQAAGPTFKALGEAVKQLFAAFGFGAKGMELMTSKGDDFRAAGEGIGRIIGVIAKFLVAGLTVAIRIAVGALKGFTFFWDVLSFVMWPIIQIGTALIWVFSQLFAIFGDVAESGNKTGGAFDYIAKAMGFALGIWVAWRSAMIVGRALMLAYRGAMMLAAGAQFVFGLATSAALAPLLGLVAAFAGGWALGAWLDDVLGLSQGLADLMGWLTGTTDEMKGLDAAYSRTVEIRGNISKFDGLEQAAKAAGMKTDAYADQRAEALVQDQAAKDLGLDKAEIKRRLLAGEGVYKERVVAGAEAPGVAAAFDAAGAQDGASGIEAQKDGKLNAGDRGADAAREAFAGALEDHTAKQRGKSRTTKQPIVVKLGDVEIASQLQEAQAALDAFNFEAG